MKTIYNYEVRDALGDGIVYRVTQEIMNNFKIPQLNLMDLIILFDSTNVGQSVYVENFTENFEY